MRSRAAVDFARLGPGAGDSCCEGLASSELAVRVRMRSLLFLGDRAGDLVIRPARLGLDAKLLLVATLGQSEDGPASSSEDFEPDEANECGI